MGSENGTALVPSQTVQISLAITTLSELREFCELLAKSDMVPKEYIGKTGNVMVAILAGRELGFQPFQAMQAIAVINGKPSIYGDAALAVVRASGLLEEFEEFYEGEGMNKVAHCVSKRKGAKKPRVTTFSVAQAQKAGLWHKQGPWTSYPDRMLQMRARGFNLRDEFTDVLKGLPIYEEIRDIEATVDGQPVQAVVEQPVIGGKGKGDAILGKIGKKAEPKQIEGPQMEPIEATVAQEPEPMPAESLSKGEPVVVATAPAEGLNESLVEYGLAQKIKDLLATLQLSAKGLALLTGINKDFKLKTGEPVPEHLAEMYYKRLLDAADKLKQK